MLHCTTLKVQLIKHTDSSRHELSFLLQDQFMYTMNSKPMPSDDVYRLQYEALSTHVAMKETRQMYWVFHIVARVSFSSLQGCGNTAKQSWSHWLESRRVTSQCESESSHFTTLMGVLDTKWSRWTVLSQKGSDFLLSDYTNVRAGVSLIWRVHNFLSNTRPTSPHSRLPYGNGFLNFQDVQSIFSDPSVIVPLSSLSQRNRTRHVSVCCRDHSSTSVHFCSVYKWLLSLSSLALKSSLFIQQE